MKLLAFDLETAREIPDGLQDWRSLGSLGMTCAAVFGDGQFAQEWWGVPMMAPEKCQTLVRDLCGLVRSGYTLVTWNGCSFDFAVLAQESGMVAECAELALDHIDLMAMVTFSQGFFLSLQKALLGAGLEGKRQTVTLSDGQLLHGMDGRQAPRLWARGEHEAVLSYLKADVGGTLALAHDVRREKAIRWISGRGRPQSARFDRLLTVRECFRLPQPDVSWMRDPPRRHQFISWMPSDLTLTLTG